MAVVDFNRRFDIDDLRDTDSDFIFHVFSPPILTNFIDCGKMSTRVFRHPVDMRETVFAAKLERSLFYVRMTICALVLVYQR